MDHSRAPSSCVLFASHPREQEQLRGPVVHEKIPPTRADDHPDLLFDLELMGDDDDACALGRDDRTTVVAEALSVLRGWQQKRAFVRTLLEHVMRLEKLIEERHFVKRMEELGKRLGRMGYQVFLRTRRGGGGTKVCLENMPHTYLVIKEEVTSSLQSREIIVETDFRSHFVIPCASKGYAELVESIPDIFVGERGLLEDIVTIMSEEMAETFTRVDRVIPPWRSKAGILSKWSQEGCNEVQLQSDGLGLCNNLRTADPACSSQLSWLQFSHANILPQRMNPIMSYF